MMVRVLCVLCGGGNELLKAHTDTDRQTGKVQSSEHARNHNQIKQGREGAGASSSKQRPARSSQAWPMQNSTTHIACACVHQGRVHPE